MPFLLHYPEQEGKQMNQTTQQIAAILNCDLDLAAAVQLQMECNGIDFSEISQRGFIREAKAAFTEINA